jgi:hypothetical protein
MFIIIVSFITVARRPIQSTTNQYIVNHLFLLLFIDNYCMDDTLALPSGDMKKYNIVRHYFEKGGRRVIDKGLTLDEAQAHCSDIETSSSTCTKPYPRSLTRKHGEWFDGYAAS